jgi:hypothetical protein
MVDLTVQDRAKILEMVDANVPYSVIASKFGCTNGTITYTMKNRESIKEKLDDFQSIDRPCRLSGDKLKLDTRVYLQVFEVG